MFLSSDRFTIFAYPTVQYGNYSMKLFAKVIRVDAILILVLFVSNCYAEVYSAYDLDNDSLEVRKNSLSFFVIGDWGRNGYSNQKEVAVQMNNVAGKMRPSFIATTGDNIYENGVASVDDPLWMSCFENVYNGRYLLIDWYPTLGNHDYRGNAQAEIDYSKKNKRWNMPARYYSFERNIPGGKDKALFVFIDSDQFEKSYYKDPGYGDLLKQDPQKEIKWLDSVLTVYNTDWKFVFGHHHVYTGGMRRGKVSETKEVLEPILKKHNVNVYFCGHEHDLQYIKPEGKTSYVVTGAGSELRETGCLPTTKFAASTQGFCAVSISDNDLLLQMIDYKGNVIYKTTIPR